MGWRTRFSGRPRGRLRCSRRGRGGVPGGLSLDSAVVGARWGDGAGWRLGDGQPVFRGWQEAQFGGGSGDDRGRLVPGCCHHGCHPAPADRSHAVTKTVATQRNRSDASPKTVATQRNRSVKQPVG